MKNTTFNIHTLGCKVNQYDGNSLKNKLLSSGWVWAVKNADLSIVNTCAVTHAAIKKARTLINRVVRENPEAKVLVTGCAARVYKEEIISNDILLVKNEKEIFKVTETLFCHSRAGGNPEFKPSEWIPAFTGMTKSENRCRYTIKIQDGCDQFCSYCIVPYARGGLKSRAPEEVIAEIEKAVNGGYEEVVLSGIHLGLYGKENKSEDRSLPAGEAGETLEENRTQLIVLLKELEKLKGLKRIRISSIEITEVDDELIKFFAQHKIMCRHLHLPLQSGCDNILKLMNRPYDTKYFENKIIQIRKAMPDIAISTDVIVGFPGEKDQDFYETKKFVKKMAFSRLHVFSFSNHEKTPAAKFAGKVSEDIIKIRSKQLRELGEELKEKFERKYIGRNLDVLVERASGQSYIGKTEYYFDIKFEKDQIIDGKQNKIIGKILEIKNLKK
jgi:threonylcarbamoyladenosine tRNA methylthiotransferase MtaB